MKWEYFYDRYADWDESTVYGRIDYLEESGSAEEVSEIVNNCEKKTADHLVNKCLSLDMKYNYRDILDFQDAISQNTLSFMIEYLMQSRKPLEPDIIAEFEDLVDEDLMNRMVIYAIDICKASFTSEQIIDLDGYVSEDILGKMAVASNHNFTEAELMDLEDVLDEKYMAALEERKWPVKKPHSASSGTRKAGILSGLAVLGALSEKKQDATGFRIGDHVRVKYRGQEGTVVDINGNLIMVALADGHTDSYEASQLEKAW